MPILPIHKGTLHYEVHGPEGAPWVTLLPGAATAMWIYEPIRDRLLPDFRVLTLEYRGMGQSRNDLWQSPPDVLAEDVLALLRHLGVATTHIANYSLGTLVGAEMLHRDPGRIARMAIGCMPVVRGRFRDEAAYLDKMSELTDFDGFKAHVMPFFLSKWYQETHPREYQAMVARQVQQTTRETMVSLQQFAGVFNHDWGRYRAYGTLPKDRRLFLTGELDYMARPVDVRQHPFTSDGPTVVFRKSGHIFFWEQLESYCAVVKHFFRTGRLPDPLSGGGMLVRLEDYAEAPA